MYRTRYRICDINNSKQQQYCQCCDLWQWDLYFTGWRSSICSGTLYSIIPNHAGCDSTITTNLSVTQLIPLPNRTRFVRVDHIRFLGRFSWSCRRFHMDVSVCCWMWQCSYYSHFCKWYLLHFRISTRFVRVDHIRFLGRFSWSCRWFHMDVSVCGWMWQCGYHSHFCKWYLFYFWISCNLSGWVISASFGRFSWSCRWFHMDVSVCGRMWQCGYYSHFCKWYLFYFWIPCNLSGWILSIALGGSADHAGDFTWTYQSLAGCDSVVTIHVSVNDTYSTSESHAICQGGSYPLPFGRFSWSREISHGRISHWLDVTVWLLFTFL